MAEIPSNRDIVSQVAPALVEYSKKVLFGEVWERPGLSKRDRSMITVAALIAMGRTEQMKGHMARALENGVTKEEIGEMVTHLAFYCGWPAGMTGGMVAHEVFEKQKK